MIFSSLEIKNFRSIDENGITIRFGTSTNIYSLVGANNSGKTNILDALALALGIRSGKFYNYSITKSDFYNQDISRQIFIKLTLHSPLKYRNVYQQEFCIKGFVFEAKSYTAGESKGQVHSLHYCIGLNAKGNEEAPLLDSDKMYKRKKGEEDNDIDNRKKPILAKEQMYKLGFFYFLDIEYLTSFFRIFGYTPLGRLFQIYKDDFQTDNSLYKGQIDGQEQRIVSREAFKKVASKIADILKTDKLKEIEDNLSQNISEYLGLSKDQKTSINLGLPDYEEIFEKLTTLKIKESQDLEELELSNLGTGYLSLLRLAIIRTLAEMTERESILYIIEEPEIYLHPHLRRFFYKTLKLLAKKGGQIIFSTHSQEFVGIHDYESVVRVDKSNSLNTLCCQVPQDLTLDFKKIHQKVRRKGNEELFFAQHAILTEGQDDKIVLEEILDKKGIDFDARSISIIDCDSKSQIPDYIKLCKSLSIDYFVVFDTDKKNPSSSTESQRIVSALDNDSTKYRALPDTLEAALKTTKSDDNWQHLLAILNGLDYNETKSKYPDVVVAIEPFADKF